VLLESEGADALTMRRLGQALGIRAPSIYKHLPGKQAVEVALIEVGLAELGEALHRALSDPAAPGTAAPRTGAQETGAQETGAQETGAQETGAQETGAQETGAAARVLASYRAESLARPNLYRLATSGPLPRGALTPGLEDWAGEPWFLAAGNPFLAQAMWSFAHGMVILELDRRYPDGSDLDQTWRAGAEAFTLAASRA
jgi:AcrR family transcriptional regulator